MPGVVDYDLIIVGGGIAGMCAALRAAQNQIKTLIFTGNRKTAKASRAKYVFNIDNMLGIHDGIILDKLRDRFSDDKEVREKLADLHFHISTRDLIDNTRGRIEAQYADTVHWVDEAAAQVTKENDAFCVQSDSGARRGRYLILATGVMDRQPIIGRESKSGKILESINWIYPYANNETVLYCIRCEGHLTRSDPCGIIGAGEGAAQIALMIHERYATPVTILTNGEALKVSGDTQKLLEAYKIAVASSPIREILGDKKGTRLDGFRLEDGSAVEVRYAFVSMGFFRVYNDLARELGIEVERGVPPEVAHVLVDHRGETSLAGAFAIGDMVRRRDEPVMKQIYTAQEYAVRAVDSIDSRLRRARRAKILSRV